jgi:hypothetical protein
MKTIIRIFSVLVILTLLMVSAAFAQSEDSDLYAPFLSDYGSITVQAVNPITVYNADGVSQTTQSVEVVLNLPVPFLSSLSDFYEDLSTMFYIVNTDGQIALDEITLGEEASGYVPVSLFFSLPADTELMDCYLVFNDQLRMLEATGGNPEPAVEAAAPEVVVTEDAAAQTGAAVQTEDNSFTINAVLDALGEPLYQAAYDDLAQGNVLKQGDTSDTVKGFQTLLVAFGYDIAINSRAGTKTIRFLKELQAAFGLEQTDTLDAEDFSFFLMCLYIKDDQDAAEELLVGGELTDSEFYYLLGGCAEVAGLYYTAYDYYMYYSSEADAYDRAQACIQAWPDKGEVYRSPDYNGNQTKLHIKIENQDEGYASYIKIYNESGDWISGLFISGSGTVTAKLLKGVYTIRIGTGEIWYGPLEAFGDEGTYETLLFDGDAEQVELKSGYEYTLTINTSTSDPEADGVGSEYTEYGDF